MYDLLHSCYCLFRLVIDLKTTKETKTKRKENEQILQDTGEPQGGSAFAGMSVIR